jgi:hypothetical protein
MATIRHHVLIDAPVAKVYQAISTAKNQHLVGQTNAHPNDRAWFEHTRVRAWRGEIEWSN